jgi:phage terminase Nu1 subunit (DNA packaging protein)
LANQDKPVTTKRIISIQDLARFLMLTDRRIQQLNREEIIPKNSDGQYEWPEAAQAYIKYTQQKTRGRPSVAGDYNTEKARLVKLQADKAELELEVMNNNLVQVDDVSSAWVSMLTDVKTKLLTIPAMISPVVAVEDNPGVVQDIIDQSLRDALRDLSNYDEIKSDSDIDEGDASPKTTKKAIGK